MHILTIDVGTGSVRAIVFDPEGRAVAEGQREWFPDLLPAHPGAQDFNTDRAWRLIAECVREALSSSSLKPSDVAAVTATSMREGMVLYDERKRAVWACSNADARAHREVTEMLAAGLGEPIYARGGDWLNIISPPRFRWIRVHLPEVYGRVAHMNMLSDWVLFKLSGELFTEPTCGSSSGIFDLADRRWSQTLIELADLPRGIYPPVREPATIVGCVTEEASRETGINKGTPVVTGGADTQLALLGTGAVRPGQFTIVGGTFWQTALVADRPLIDPGFRLRTLCHVLPGQWMVEGIGFYHGFAMRWFRDGFCDNEKRESVSSGLSAYALMEARASAIPPGSNGVHAIFSNVMNARCWKHAVPAFLGFDIMDAEGTGKAACVRAIEESAAYVSRAHLEILLEISGFAPPVITFCGGASKGTLWPRILADVTGVPVRVPVVKEATSLGSAMCAGVALGWYRDIGEAAGRLVRWERTFEPVSENACAYDGHYRKWRAVYPSVMSIADAGLLPSMWRAPGV